jgi:hypothetical protein
MPIYSHALELALKAYLRSKGVTSNQLASRAFGHSLQVLWDTCVDQGLTGHPVSDAFISQIVEFLNPFATDFEFRYIRVGLKNLPTLDAVEDAVAKLIATVRPYCEATVNGAIAD